MAESRATWPSVEQQISAAGARRGTALERLIRENQQFDLLRAEEATDALGLPLWLRVFWRKAHPEGRFSPDDPSGGYPRALRRLLAWMLSHQDLQPNR